MQTLINGMGELHLEIAQDRLVNDFKAKASMGKIEIGYRECVVSGSFKEYVVYDREIAGRRGKAGCEAIISRDENQVDLETSFEQDGNTFSVSIQTTSIREPEEVGQLPSELPPKILHKALIDGASAALARGPRRGFPLHSSHIKLTFSTITDLFGAYTTPAAVASAARLAVQAALREAHKADAIGLLEPVMNVVISCDESSLGAVIHDLSSARGGHVLSLGDDNAQGDSGSELPIIDPAKIYAPPDPFGSTANGSGVQAGPGQQRHVTARVPLKEMLGYLKHLRSLTGGRGSFVMSVDRFERLSGPREKAV
jgi:elongation factor G